jgi:hypothetical protein
MPHAFRSTLRLALVFSTGLILVGCGGSGLPSGTPPTAESSKQNPGGDAVTDRILKQNEGKPKTAAPPRKSSDETGVPNTVTDPDGGASGS